MAENNQAFLLFAIGPVQDFIATARRTHDLWAGSRLLSLLMVDALKKAEEAGATPIFPLPNAAGEWPKSVPNRAVLEVPSTTDGKELGALMENAVQEAWRRIEQGVKGRFSSYVPKDEKYDGWDQLWQTQNKGWLERYWITWPAQANYPAGYQTASEMLDARKRLRPISPRVEEGEKCTLSGVMAALPDPKLSREAMRNFWQAVRTQVKKAGNISETAVRRGEQLCSVSIVKRFADAHTILQDEKRRFPSTSSIAAADFRLALLQNWSAVQNEVAAWMDAADRLELPTFNTPEPIACLRSAAQMAAGNGAERFLKYDGDYLYPDFYTESRILEAWGEEEKDRLTDKQKKKLQKLSGAAKALRALYTACQKTEPPIVPPSPYYAVLKMDGDDMGKTLSNKIGSAAKHREFSGRLARFAQNDVPAIVEEDAPGALVYAGGDDALALLPVSHALPVAETLRRRFVEKLSDDSPEGWGELHASTGLVFVHHQAPLQTAVRQATTMEKAAKSKKKYGRNAIAVKLLRRSGEPHEMGSKWMVGTGTPLPVADVMEKVRQSMVQNELAAKFAYEVAANAAALSEVPPAALRLEIGRLLRRHWDEQKRRTPAAQTKMAAFTDELAEVAQASSERAYDLGRWLLLVAFLAKRGGDT